MTDGTKFQTRSTYGKEGDTLHLDIDPTAHPAWTGGTGKMLDAGGQAARFHKRLRGLTPRAREARRHPAAAPPPPPAGPGGPGKVLDAGGQVARFNKRFGGLTLGKK